MRTHKNNRKGKEVMKKLMAFVLACACTFSLAACGDTKTEANTTKEETSTEVETNEETDRKSVV